MTAEYESVDIPCALDPEHQHYAYIRLQLGGKSVLEVVDSAQSEGEVAGGLRAIFRSLVDWDLHDAKGERLPITQATVDELHIQQINVLKAPAIKAFHAGNTPLPNASGGRSPSTSSGNRSQRRSAKSPKNSTSTD